MVAVAPSGEAVARRVAGALGAALHGREGRVAGDVAFPDTVAHLRDLFAAGVPIVGVCAAGVLIRAVAPLLSDKRAEPPVVAVAEDGSCAVPLLGGHRGANALARRVAEALGGVAAVTTAGDLALGVALDAPPEGWRLANPEDAGAAMAAALAGGLRMVGGVAFDGGERAASPARGRPGEADGPDDGGAPLAEEPSRDRDPLSPDVAPTDGGPLHRGRAPDGGIVPGGGDGPRRGGVLRDGGAPREDGLAACTAEAGSRGEGREAGVLLGRVGRPTGAGVDPATDDGGGDRAGGGGSGWGEMPADRDVPDEDGADAAPRNGGATRGRGSPFDVASRPDGAVALLATEAPTQGGPRRLVYHPRRHVLGLGCARGADPAALRRLVEDVLSEAGIAAGAIAAVATIDLKADEPAIVEAARRLGVPLRLLDAEALEAETPRLANPSARVFAEVGAHGVAEAGRAGLRGGGCGARRPEAQDPRGDLRAGPRALAHHGARGEAEGARVGGGHRAGAGRLAHAGGVARRRVGRRDRGLRALHRPAGAARRRQAARGLPARRRGGALPPRAGAGGRGARRGARVLGRRGRLRDGLAGARAGRPGRGVGRGAARGGRGEPGRLGDAGGGGAGGRPARP